MFTQDAMKVIWTIPLIFTVCLLIAALIRALTGHRYRRPIWLRNILGQPQDPLKPVDLSRSRPRATNPLWQILMIAVLGFAMQLVKYRLVLFDKDRKAKELLLQPSLLLLGWVRLLYECSTHLLTLIQLLMALHVTVVRLRSASPSLIVVILALGIIEVISWLNSPAPLRGHLRIPNVVCAIAALLAVMIVGNLPMTDPRLSTVEVSPAYDLPTKDLRSPEDNITLWQFLTVSWMGPLISLGSARQLHEPDVWTLGYQFLHRPLHDAFQEVRGSMIWRLVQANGLDIAITSLLGLIELLMNFAVPIALQQLLRRMQDPNSPPRAAITYGMLILVARLVSAQVAQLNTWYSRRSYERSRGEMITTMYEKTMSRKISMVGSGGLVDDPKEMEQRRAASKGKIFNLMRGDVYNVAQRFWEIPPLIQRPLGLILSVVLVWKIIGWPCLLGMLTVVAGQIINAVAIRYLLKLERRRRAITDAKLQRTSSLVEAIRHLRWYGWQNLWLERIMEARQRELNLRVLTGLFRIIIGTIINLSSAMFPVVSFFAYTKLAGLRLTVDIAFPAIHLFGMLEDNLREIPELITVMLNAYIAVDRLQAFLEEDDKVDERAPSDAKLRLKHASFAWPGTMDCILHDLTLELPVGLTIITGKVGSGKTAFLQSILGELDLRDGELVCPEGSVAYSAQIPWLESKSIRENVTFAMPYEETRYKQVIEACALIPDFSSFKNGDLTNIGENGVGLSGGQKARIALARAVYTKARILLLDDPLSALDLTTSKHILDRCFASSLLKDRTVLLITNHPELMEGLAVQAIVIDDGRAKISEHDVSRAFVQSSASTAIDDDSDSMRKKDGTDEAIPDKFIEDEHRSHGGVKAAVYWQYIKAGQPYLWILFVFGYAVHRSLGVVQKWFLKEWGEAYGTEQYGSGHLNFLSKLPSPEEDVVPWLLWFLTINLLQVAINTLLRCLMLVIVYVTGKRMFQEVMIRVCYTTFRFYDVTPVGRLMNRLTGDIETVDGNISNQFQGVIYLAIRWIASIIVISSVTPTFLIFSSVLVCAFLFIFFRFLPTSQSLRRLEMVSLSPLMTDFGTLMDGLLTIRAFCAQQRFQDRLIKVVDNFQGMDHFYWSLQAWLQYRFDLLSAFSTFILTLLAILTKVSPGLTAFVLISANTLVSSTHALCKRYGQLQMDFVSVERVVELLHLEQEPPGTIEPPASWPSRSGDIEFDNLTIRYAPHLEPAINNVSFNIRAGDKIALIGRTGCGKTTLALSLLATLLPETGRVSIDGIDIADVNKQTLRSRVTFLAQEPVLFPGTIRENLDPLQQHSDSECEDVLARTCDGYGWTLATHVESGGKNLSQGQRQLVALARALLRRSEIVIMDEATASIDAETATRMQDMIREELSGSTVITIAHRMEAIRSADYCIVLSKGRVVEKGSPIELLKDGGSMIVEELQDTK